MMLFLLYCLRRVFCLSGVGGGVGVVGLCVSFLVALGYFVCYAEF